MANTILLRGRELNIRKEANCGPDEIWPGMLVEIDPATENAKPQSTADARVQVAVAFENELFGNGISGINVVDNTTVSYKENSQVLFDTLPRGCEFLGFLPAGAAAIANRALVTSDGAGGVKEGTAANAIGIALEEVDNSTNTESSHIKIEAL